MAAVLRSCGQKDGEELLGSTPPVAHVPGERWQQKAQANNKGMLPKTGECLRWLSRMAVLGGLHIWTPASVRGHHVVIRPDNEPSCICRSLCSCNMHCVLCDCWLPKP
jgi:hypothetical protein